MQHLMTLAELSAEQQNFNLIAGSGIVLGSAMIIGGLHWAKKRKNAGLKTAGLGFIIAMVSLVFVVLSAK